MSPFPCIQFDVVVLKYFQAIEYLEKGGESGPELEGIGENFLAEVVFEF